MSNTFLPLPAPAANGSGAQVDVSALGADKTITVKIPVQNGVPSAQVLIEYSNDNAHLIWSPLVQFTKPGIRTVQIAARYLRATVLNYTGAGAPVVNVGAEDNTVTFVELIAPVGNGNGAAVDVSALPGFKTIQINGTYKGVCNIEISDDAGVSYATVASFQQKGGTWSGIAYGDRMRISRSGLLAREATPGTFTCDIGAVPLSGGGSTPTVDQAVIFDDSVAAAEVNIRSDRASQQSAIDNTKHGITNFGNKSNTVASSGATKNYSTIGGGDDNSATGDFSTVPGGNRNTASGESSFAANFRNTASGFGASAFGATNTVAGDDGFACGENNTITAQGDGGAFCSGQANTVSGDTSHAEGRGHTVSGDYAHSEGRDGIASGTASHSEGDSCHATNGSAHAEGTSTTASGANAHAEGASCTASADNSHAEGNSTTASATEAHAQGLSSVASGVAAHAEGRLCTASGVYSHAQGYYAKANRETQFSHASGRIQAQGDAQTGQIVMRKTTADAPIAATSLVFGVSPLSAIVLEAQKCYGITVFCTASGGADGAISAYIKRDFIVRTDGGTATVIASGVASIIGHATAVAAWVITANTPGGLDLNIQFSTGADGATTNITVAARVEFVEVLNLA